MAIANTTKAVTQRRMDPYGALRGASVAWPGDRGFLGKPLDATGLTQVGARYYEASIGRFISVDPVMDASNPQQWAGYSYAENNPVTYSDPTGMLSQIDGQYSSGAASRRRVPWANWLRKGSPGRTVDVACTTSSWERCAGGATKRVPVTRRAPVMSLAVGVTPEQSAYNEAWARSDAAQIIRTQAPWQQTAYRLSQGIDRSLRPAVPLLLATSGLGLGGALARSQPVPATTTRAPSAGGARTAAAAEEACVGGACRVPGQMCFVAGTGVLLASGATVAIEDVTVGDRVVTTDPTTGEESVHAVTRLYRHDDARLFDVVIDGSTVTATPAHPFWVVGRGWVTVDQLHPGDALLQPDDTTIAVEAVRATGRTATVYNFEVEDAHDYYVKAGTTGFLCTTTVLSQTQSRFGARPVPKPRRS